MGGLGTPRAGLRAGVDETDDLPGDDLSEDELGAQHEEVLSKPLMAPRRNHGKGLHARVRRVPHRFLWGHSTLGHAALALAATLGKCRREIHPDGAERLAHVTGVLLAVDAGFLYWHPPDEEASER